MDKTKQLIKTSLQAWRLLTYTLPCPVWVPRPAHGDDVAPNADNRSAAAFITYVKLQTGQDLKLRPWRTDLKAIQRREKYYYALFPGLLTGNITASAAVPAEHAAFASCLEYLHHPSRMTPDLTPQSANDILQLDAAQRDPTGQMRARLGSSLGEDLVRPAKVVKEKTVGKPFRFDEETLSYDGDLYLSRKALEALGPPLNFDANTIHGDGKLCKNDSLYRMLLRTITHMHQRMPREKFFQSAHGAPLLRKAKPLAQRPLVDGWRARGAAWTEAEDAKLRELFSQSRRDGCKEDLKADRADHEREMRAAMADGMRQIPPFNARAARQKLERELWKVAVEMLPERTELSVRSRLKHLNNLTRNKYILNGKMRTDYINDYRREYLGLYNTMPRFRTSEYVPKRLRTGSTPDAPQPTPPVEIRPWIEREDEIVIEVFVQNNGRKEREHAMVVNFPFRTPDEVLTRAWALKKQGYLPNTDLPYFRWKPGRPNRSLRATKMQPSAIPKPAQHRSDLV